MPRLRRIGHCELCLGWGSLLGPRYCPRCVSWRRIPRERRSCRACRHVDLVNQELLCRCCALDIRFHDSPIVDLGIGPRFPQLALILPGIRLTTIPADGPVRRKPPSWAAAARAAARLQSRQDDSAVCPAVLPGQMPLFSAGVRRHLTVEHAQRIRDRPLAGLDAVAAVIAERGAQRSEAWREQVRHMTRLALAIRDAEGGNSVQASWLADLSRYRSTTASILREAGILVDPDLAAVMPARQRTQRSCDQCGSWGLTRRCPPCAQWIRMHPATGLCQRCQQRDVHLDQELCRACHIHLSHQGPDAAASRGVQLWLGGPFALRLQTARGILGYQPTDKSPRRVRARQRTQPAGRHSPHRIDPDQPTLFDARRDWRGAVTGERWTQTPAARAVLAEFDRFAALAHWSRDARYTTREGLTLILGWVGADAAIAEQDVLAIRRAMPHVSGSRISQFLSHCGLLAGSANTNPHDRAVERMLDSLPTSIAKDVGQWVQVLRGGGRRPRPPVKPVTIRSYVHAVHPVLMHWTTEVSTLREITRHHIESVLHGYDRPRARLARPLRSLFGALKQERIVFRDPTRGIRIADPFRLPTPLPSDRLAGLLDAASDTGTRIMIALIAVHALTRDDLRHLRLQDLDLPHAEIHIRRGADGHTVHLDPLTYQLITDWLRERQRRWPTTINTHLLVTARTAHDHRRGAAISEGAVSKRLQLLGVNASSLRADRLLDEARVSEDPVHLMRLFGITAKTAMRYVRTAHPERGSLPPR